jgi:hypothetical protein
VSGPFEEFYHSMIASARFVCADGREFLFACSEDEQGKPSMLALPFAPAMTRADFEATVALEVLDECGRIARCATIRAPDTDHLI